MSTRGAAPGAPLIDHGEPIHDRLADWRAESIGRLLRDASRAVRRWAPKGLNRLDRDALAQDAVCHVLNWTRSGDPTSPDDTARYVIDCGAAGCAPSREVWRASDDWREPSNSAWILLHRAIVQALRAPDRLGWRPPRKEDGLPRETPTDPTELDALRETHGAELAPSLAQLGADHAATENASRGDYSPIPDDISVRALADAGEIPVQAARALAKESLGMSREDAARSWGMTVSGVDVAVSRGAKWIRDTYPETAQLAAMLRDASRKIRADRLERATDAVYDFLYAEPGDITDGDGADIPRDVLRREALRAVIEWRESSRTAPASIVALEVATRRAYWRRSRRLRYVEDGADIAREIRRAVDSAKRAEYARLAAPGSVALYTAPENPALCPIPRSAIVARWIGTHPRARRETTLERATRAVRETAPATIYVVREPITRRAERDTAPATHGAAILAYWTARVDAYARCAPGTPMHIRARNALRDARRTFA